MRFKKIASFVFLSTALVTSALPAKAQAPRQTAKDTNKASVEESLRRQEVLAQCMKDTEKTLAECQISQGEVPKAASANPSTANNTSSK